MKPEKPTPDDFATAIAWLNHNDGDNGEAEACSRVAEWLRAKMEDEAPARNRSRGRHPIRPPARCYVRQTHLPLKSQGNARP
jgi:hypothetical protein